MMSHDTDVIEGLPGYAPLGSFSWALMRLKEGAMIARKGWNGKGMHIYLEIGRHLPINAGVYAGTARVYEAVICMYTVQKTHQPGWLASQADLLASDWEEITES